MSYNPSLSGVFLSVKRGETVVSLNLRYCVTYYYMSLITTIISEPPTVTSTGEIWSIS